MSVAEQESAARTVRLLPGGHGSTAGGRVPLNAVARARADCEHGSVTSRPVDLTLPPALSTDRRAVLLDVASRNEAAHGADLLGLVLSGSVGRGVETDRSDVDVYVVLTDEGVTGRGTTRSTTVDEIPVALSELEDVPPFGSDGWWYRWSFAWAPVLLDRTDGRLRESLRRQATVTVAEAEEILVAHDRLDGWINYAYRALKSDRDGRALERRLDAAESIPWLLDTVFTLAGRVRPYHKYLPWELREHPLPGWEPDELVGLIEATLDGDPSAIRATFTRVERACAAFDSALPEPVLGPVIEGWGDELTLFRGRPRSASRAAPRRSHADFADVCNAHTCNRVHGDARAGVDDNGSTWSPPDPETRG